MFKYEFNNKVYVQDKLVWGQVKQLASVLKEVKFATPLTYQSLIEILGDKLPTAIAIVMVEEGVKIKGRDIEKIAEEFEDSLPFDVAVQVVEDFFICNPIASLLEKLAGMMDKVNEKMEETLLPNGKKKM